jgi:hypothetical protein
MTREDYLHRLLALYCGLPHTAARRPSRADRSLAAQLFDQGVELALLEAALLLATARRCSRDPDLPPLPPIRSLAYFLPVLAEIRQAPPDPEYLSYLRLRLDVTVQFPTDSDDR